MEGSSLRASRRERETAVATLGTHLSAGRIGPAEFDQRTQAAYQASTRAQLADLFTDLPQPQPNLDGDTAVAATDSAGEHRVGEPGRCGWPVRLGYGLFGVAGAAAVLLMVLTGHWFWILLVPLLAYTARRLAARQAHGSNQARV